MKNPYLMLAALILLPPRFLWPALAGGTALKAVTVKADHPFFGFASAPAVPQPPTEAQLLELWNARENGPEALAMRSRIDLDSVKEFNLELASLWDRMTACANSPRKLRENYLSGDLCPDNSEESRRMAGALFNVNRRIAEFSRSSWVGGNGRSLPTADNGALPEVPAFHPLFAQLLIESLSVEVRGLGVTWGNLVFNAATPIRASDKFVPDEPPASRSELARLLLLAYLPASQGLARGGLFPCASRQVMSYFAAPTRIQIAPPDVAQANTSFGWQFQLAKIEDSLGALCVPAGQPDPLSSQGRVNLAAYVALSERLGTFKKPAFVRRIRRR